MAISFSINPNTMRRANPVKIIKKITNKSEIIPNELNAGLLRGVVGTAIFRRSISPSVGRKLLMNGFPFDSGPAVLPVANWYGARLGTPV